MQKLAFPFGIGLALIMSAAHTQQKAHEHGSANLNVAIDGDAIEMELIAPGADIVGFEHQPNSDADRAAVDAAVVTFQRGIFTLPESAGCELEAVGIYSALLPDGEPVHSGEHHHDDDHGHGHGHDDHGRDKKDDHAHDDHGHDHGEKDGRAHDDHGHDHEKKDDHAHDDHDHGDHKDGEEHAEFRVHFHYECKEPAALTGMQTSYFEDFPNAQELDVAALTGSGQVAAELTRANARLEF